MVTEDKVGVLCPRLPVIKTLPLIEREEVVFGGNLRIFLYFDFFCQQGSAGTDMSPPVDTGGGWDLKRLKRSPF